MTGRAVQAARKAEDLARRVLYRNYHPAKDARPGTTHVLEYVPEWQVDDGLGPALWMLVTLENYGQGIDQDAPQATGIPRNAPIPHPANVAALRAWTEQQLGCRVNLYPGAQTIAPCADDGQRTGRYRAEPIYWVVPA